MMSTRFDKRNLIAAICAVVFLFGISKNADAQFNTVNQIGGIYVDGTGVLNNATEQMRLEAQQAVQQKLAALGDKAQESSELRAISVRAIEKALADVAAGKKLSDEVKFMGGIQRIQYVIVQPEHNDILLAGPGEGWKVDSTGNVVGSTTGRPVIRLEDFITALRTADGANQDYGITVSIDPTEEGKQRLERLWPRVKQAGGFIPEMKEQVEAALGAQNISLTGMPTDSRMAQVLVAADYRMKRMAMGFEKSAVEGIPSVLDLSVDRKRAMKTSPRFWLECNYDAVKRSEDGLTWKIEGAGAKALTAVSTKSGKNDKSSPVGTKWAENMTTHFAALADADPVFAELQNVMDMAVVAAMIRKHDLMSKASLSTPVLMGDVGTLPIPKWSVPKTVSTQCSFVRIKNSWMITASGGVSLDSWKVLENISVDNSIASVSRRVSSLTEENSAWWNAAN